MSPPIVLDCLVGDRVRVRAVARDYDGEQVTPTQIAAFVGPRGEEPEQVDVTIQDGVVTFEVEAREAGLLAFQVTATEPVDKTEHGLIRVSEPVFGGR